LEAAKLVENEFDEQLGGRDAEIAFEVVDIIKALNPFHGARLERWLEENRRMRRPRPSHREHLIRRRSG